MGVQAQAPLVGPVTDVARNGVDRVRGPLEGGVREALLYGALLQDLQ